MRKCPNCGAEFDNKNRVCITKCMEFEAGEEVLDTLTGKRHRIVKIDKADFIKSFVDGIWIDSDYLDGGRYPWEVDKI